MILAIYIPNHPHQLFYSQCHTPPLGVVVLMCDIVCTFEGVMVFMSVRVYA